MADVITEFYNDTIPLTDFADDAKVALVTNSSTETAVVKEIRYSAMGLLAVMPVALTVGGAEVSSMSSSLGGTEMIGVNSTLEAGISGLKYEDVSLKVYTGSGGELLKIDFGLFGGIAVFNTESEIALGGAQPALTYFGAVVDDSETWVTVFGYNGNDQSQIIKDLVSDGSTVSSGPTTAYCGEPAYGGDDYVYWSHYSNIYRMSTNSAADGAVWCTGISGYGSSSYPYFGTNPQPSPTGERVCIYAGTGSSNTYATWADASTGAKRLSNIQQGQMGTGLFASANGAGKLIPFYSPATSAWRVLFAATNGEVRLGTLSETTATITVEASTTMPFQAGRAQVTVIDDAIYCLDETTGSLLVYDLDLNLVNTVVSGLSSLTSMTGTQTPIVAKSVPSSGTIAGRDYSTVGSRSLRITGIKTTEVV